MNIAIWLLIGGLIGWAASMLMDAADWREIILNVVVGTIGAACGKWLFGGGSPITQGNLSLIGVIVSVLGAVFLIAVIKLFRRATTRPLNVSVISRGPEDESSERNMNRGFRARVGRIITKGPKRS